MKLECARKLQKRNFDRQSNDVYTRHLSVKGSFWLCLTSHGPHAALTLWPVPRILVPYNGKSNRSLLATNPPKRLSHVPLERLLEVLKHGKDMTRPKSKAEAKARTDGYEYRHVYLTSVREGKAARLQTKRASSKAMRAHNKKLAREWARNYDNLGVRKTCLVGIFSLSTYLAFCG